MKITEITTLQKAHSFQIIKYIDRKFWQHKLKTWMKIVSKFHIPIFYAFW